MTWTAFLGFTCVLAATLGLVVAFGLRPLAQGCNRLSLDAAMFAYSGLSIAASISVLAIEALLFPDATGLEWRASRPPEYGPGYGIGAVIAIGIAILSGAALGLLLLIGRLSERAMVAVVVVSLALGWWVVGNDLFSLCGTVLTVVSFEFFDSNAYSPAMRNISTAVFLVVCGATSLSLATRKRRGEEKVGGNGLQERSGTSRRSDVPVKRFPH